MPSTGKHLKRAQQHLVVANKWASDEESLGWAAVVLFYAARDLVHACFDADPHLPAVCRHPESHTNQDLHQPGTNSVVKRHYRAVAAPYMDLYAMSTGVRYKGQEVTEQQWQELFEDFRDICRWAALELVAAGRYVPDWLSAT